jgi:hypothetical protein
MLDYSQIFDARARPQARVHVQTIVAIVRKAQ